MKKQDHLTPKPGKEDSAKLKLKFILPIEKILLFQRLLCSAKKIGASSYLLVVAIVV